MPPDDSRLVSCVMPTRGRQDMARAALDCWLKQDWLNRELIVVDDEDCPSFPDGLDMEGIRYSRLSQRITLGAKRNLVCSMAAGDVICHFDDDDWSAPDRIAYQVGLLESSGKPITGFGHMLFWDVMTQQAKRYRPTIPHYICGTSFCMTKDLWRMNPFKDKQIATDNAFIYPIMSQVEASGETRFMVARIHGGHTSTKSAIKEIVPRETLPAGFWENEKVRME